MAIFDSMIWVSWKGNEGINIGYVFRPISWMERGTMILEMVPHPNFISDNV